MSALAAHDASGAAAAVLTALGSKLSCAALTYAWGKVCFSAWDSTLELGGERVLHYSQWPEALRGAFAALYPAYFVFAGAQKLPPQEQMEREAVQDTEYQGSTRSPATLISERCQEQIAQAMGLERPSAGEVAKGLLFEGPERRRQLLCWLRSPRHRVWIRPEDITDQLEESAECKFRSLL